MAEHFTKSTVSASFWCAKCRKATLHRVDNGRRGPCFDCMETLAKAVAPLAPAAKQESLRF
jgi:hypothetical protein